MDLFPRVDAERKLPGIAQFQNGDETKGDRDEKAEDQVTDRECEHADSAEQKATHSGSTFTAAARRPKAIQVSSFVSTGSGVFRARNS